MIAVAAPASLPAADTPGAWVMVGVSPSGLRVFIERATLTVAGDRRTVRVRIGSPGAITGRIVLVYQDEEIDCRAATWRMTGYEVHGADGGILAQRSIADAPMMPAVDGTMGGKIVATACSL